MATEPDNLEDFEKGALTAAGMSFELYTSRNAGPPVIVLHEATNLTPHVARFARVLVGEGFQVFMPSLVGRAGDPPGGVDAAEWAAICLRKEFRGFVGQSTRPVVRWIRALVQKVTGPPPGRRVGVIGMCFSGGFALGAATEPAVAAAVTCQPGLPLTGALGYFSHVTGADDDIDLDDADLQALRGRLDAGGLRLQAYRFIGDEISPCARLRRLTARLGPGLDARCLPNSAANPAVRHPPSHSVVSLHLIDELGQPTREARDRIVRFLDWRLRDGARPGAPSPSLRDCAALGCVGRT
jgi:dienelactone hydrolase